jgi:pimeloyl-ACP methyl ester carboxylesterase
MIETWVRSADGISLAVGESEGRGRKSILLIHGYGHSKECFVRQYASELSKTYHIVSFDLRGHGRSEAPNNAEAYAAKRWSDDVRSVIEACEMSYPVLVGWSLGARVIGQYLKDCGSSSISGINLVGGRPTSKSQQTSIGESMTQVVITAQEKDPHLRMSAARSFVEACAYQPLPRDYLEEMVQRVVAMPLVAAAGALGFACDYGPEFESLEVPVLITQGARDQLVLPIAATELHAQIPESNLSLYSDAGHAPFLERPERFNGELAQFVERVSLS